MNMLEYAFLKTGEDLAKKIEDFFNTSWLRPCVKFRQLRQIMTLRKDWKVLKSKHEANK